MTFDSQALYYQAGVKLKLNHFYIKYNSYIFYIMSCPIDLTQYDEKHHEYIRQYISSLNDLEIKAMLIAKDNLESSFNIVKSIGFEKWKKNL